LTRSLAQVVEVDVAGELDRVAEVDQAVAALLVTVELAAVELGVPRTEDLRVRVHQVHRQRAVRQKRFDDRARRIHVLDGAVLQRTVRVLQQARPLDGRDAAGEPVRVVGGRRDQCEDLAGLRIQGDDRPDLVAEVFLGDFLQLQVDREKEVLTGAGLQAIRLGDLAAV
jgi:hypothetical protein